MFQRLLLLGLALFSFTSNLNAQSPLTGQLIDATTNDPLPYASIIHSTKGRGALTNDEGRFQLRLPTYADSLMVSFIGYRTREVPADHFVRYDTLRLTPTSYQLTGATVYANDDYLYELVVEAGRRLKADDPQTAKGFTRNSVFVTYPIF